MTLISMIKSVASSSVSIVQMFDVAYNWNLINNQYSKSNSSSGVLNAIFSYGLPILNTVLMGLSLMKP